MGKRDVGRTRLSREDWIQAALGALGAGGLGALAVEPIARDLGVTKGSFYWHFENLDALIAATLERWAVIDTANSIAVIEQIENPRERLERLMSPPAGQWEKSRVDIALLAAAADTRVSPWLRKQHRLWLDFAGRAYSEMGFGLEEAARRALFSYSSYLGLMQVRLTIPEVVASEDELTALFELMRSVLIPPKP